MDIGSGRRADKLPADASHWVAMCQRDHEKSICITLKCSHMIYEKNLFFVLLLTTTTIGFSQEPKQEPFFIPGHEIHLGVGFFPVMRKERLLEWWEFYDGIGDMNSNNLSTAYDRELIYFGKERIKTSISVGYIYNINYWLSAGAMFSYAGMHCDYFDKISNVEVGSYNMRNFSFAPMVRLIYFQRKYFSFYTQLELGVGLRIIDQPIDNERNGETKLTVAGQYTLVGMSVGNKIFGFWELLGVGTRGIVSVGAGYRFNHKNSNK